MAKKKTEPKFRVVRLALSNDAYALLEGVAKSMKVSKSKIITELLEGATCPLGILDRIASYLEAKALQLRTPPAGQDALDFRRGKEIEKKSAMLMSLDAKLDAWHYEKAVYEKLRDTLADMPDDEVGYEKAQNLARLKGLDANIEMAKVLRQEEIENLEFKE